MDALGERPGSLLLLALLTGVVTGIFVVFYALLTRALSWLLFWGDPLTTIPTLPLWYLYLVPILSIYLVNRMILHDDSVREYGVQEIAEAVEGKGLNFGLKDLLLKIFASSLSLASGFAVGNEGPSAAIGAMIAQRFHRLLRLPRHLLRVALSVGASSGIAAVFVSPVTGIMFAVENLAHPFIRNYAGTLIAGSLLAFAVASSVLEPLLFGYSTGKALDYHYLIATGLFIPTITLFVYLYLGLKDRILFLLEGWFERRFRRGRILILSIVSGALIATILRIDPLAGFSGHEVVRIFINGSFHWPVWMIFTVILLRILATTLSLYANAVGGLFIALMSIGALIGYGFGEVSNLLFPWQVESFYFAAIGSAVFMGVLMRLPLTALVLALEITYDYNVIVPTGLAVILATYFANLNFNIRKLKATDIRINIEEAECHYLKKS